MRSELLGSMRASLVPEWLRTCAKMATVSVACAELVTSLFPLGLELHGQSELLDSSAALGLEPELLSPKLLR